MRLLVVNFTMDSKSPVLAWQQRVALRLAEGCEHITVLTGSRGKFVQPANMDVNVVPRWMVRWPVRRLGAKRLMNLSVERWCRRWRFDACFMHMDYEWSYLLEPVLRRWKIPVLLWYAHGSVTPALQRALGAVDVVVTSTAEGFRIPSPKIRIIGQAIDTELFKLCQFNAVRDDILYVGRISPRKRIELLIDSMCELKQAFPDSPAKLKIVGPTLNRTDEQYLRNMMARAVRAGVKNCVEFCGAKSQEDLPALYATAFLHLNVSATGSMDKTVMEALAVGCPVLTSNEAIVPVLARQFPEMVITDPSPAAIAKQIAGFHRTRDSIAPSAYRALIAGHHDLHSYTAKIMGILHELSVRGRSSNL